LIYIKHEYYLDKSTHNHDNNGILWNIESLIALLYFVEETYLLVVNMPS